MTALNLGIHESGNPEIWKFQNIEKLKLIRMEIRPVQNAGEVLISKGKNIPAHLA